MKYWICVVFLSLHNTLSPVSQASASSCLSGKTCSDCIQQTDCVWCSDVIGLLGSRCRNSSFKNNMCSLEVSMKDLQNNQSDQCLCDLHSDKNAEICNNNGSLRCGACYCNPGYSGKFCQCLTPSDHNISSEYDVACKAPNDTRICSGRGTCICGKCECNVNENPKDYVYGLYCECDNFSCERNSEGILCGNSPNAECVCGYCVSKVMESSAQMSIFRGVKNYAHRPTM